jgi:non-specific serine/threonine protein kinase
LQSSFARGANHGVLQLGAGEVGTALPAVFSYWREFAARYVTALCTHPSLSADVPGIKTVEAVVPPGAKLEWLAMAASPMTRAENLSSAVVSTLWHLTDKALRLELSEEQPTASAQRGRRCLRRRILDVKIQNAGFDLCVRADQAIFHHHDMS